jgi:D-apiose dehydrogenase
VRRRIAIAGLGAAARQIHLPAYAKLADLQVVGGYDPASGSARLPFPLFGSLQELLDKTAPDILAVASPPAHHHEAVRMALRAGCHVFCEKPFVTSLEEADDIVAMSREHGRWVVVNNQYRFMNIHSRAKEVIGTAAFGELLFASASQTFFVSSRTEAGWRGQGARRTCLEFGIHVLDLCRYFFGEDPAAIDARMPKAGAPHGPDYLNLIRLEFSRDRVAQICLDRLSRGPHRYLDLRLDGSEGCVETSIGGGIELAAGIRGGTRRPYLGLEIALGGRARLYHGEAFRRLATAPLNVFAHGTARLMRAFLDALEQGATPPCHAEDNRRSLALALAAYDSQERGRAIELRY